MWLHDMPHMFSSMQAWQISNPQRQRQQNGKLRPQQWQRWTLGLRHRRRRVGPGVVLEVFLFGCCGMASMP
jgi:hypothetical protein